jgi:hypothetical protein
LMSRIHPSIQQNPLSSSANLLPSIPHPSVWNITELGIGLLLLMVVVGVPP